MRFLTMLACLALLACAACKPAPVTVSGTVTYRERMALPADAVMRVAIEDITQADTPAKLLASATIKTAGRQVPIHYEITVADPTRVDPKHEYGLRVRIENADGTLMFINDTRYGVITNGVMQQDVVVKRVATP